MKAARRENTNTTARGALIIALYSLGVYSTPTEAFEAVSKNDIVTEFYPDEKTAAAYEVYRKEMNHTYEQLWKTSTPVLI